jgi:UDP-N-acetylglucosamine--N-acetylmuramyl-(pentapeptide) pyrophosphoryl-undecaprenol N-acetylglucosamine transferase
VVASSGGSPSAQPVRLLVTGGGTGGHTYPAVAVVRAVRSRLAGEGRELAVLWAGAEASLESRVAAGEGIVFAAVATGKLRRASNPLKMLSLANVRDLVRVPVGFLQARAVVRRFAPDVVLATGGYVVVPVALAARSRRRPLVIHEQTVRLGLANRLLARSATAVAVSSESTLPLLPAPARRSAVVTGNPVRAEVLRGRADAAAQALGWHIDPSLPVMYVTGGAQGSAQVNELVSAILPWLVMRANVIHQCGAAAVDGLRDRGGSLPSELGVRYLAIGFVGAELPDVLALADVVVSRSGAGTIAELTALGKAAVLVPLATAAGDEQRHNARHLTQHGAAVALLDAVTPDALREALDPLLADPGLREKLAQNARMLGRPDAAERLADVVLAVVGPPSRTRPRHARLPGQTRAFAPPPRKWARRQRCWGWRRSC